MPQDAKPTGIKFVHEKYQSHPTVIFERGFFLQEYNEVYEAFLIDF